MEKNTWLTLVNSHFDWQTNYKWAMFNKLYWHNQWVTLGHHLVSLALSWYGESCWMSWSGTIIRVCQPCRRGTRKPTFSWKPLPYTRSMHCLLGGYCCSWLFRTLLEAQMWQQGFGCSSWRKIFGALPGPDEDHNLSKVAETADEMSAKKLLKLGYKLSPHFFAMTACLHAPRTAREEAMKESQEKLSRGSSTPVERDSSGAQHHD